ncbi:hypothetical protein C7974DRAFT_111796 [Boeremia exigua]|uniref:uncharacterized protein n=1 Tax=Boeremia exigua TaxID=749465 RepID=UPI001E8EEBBD|nr:uncharacterized protein C7974DRAFT_111796 [Boeremia exigua]KAH6642850.1 hypothetical protein C7974DRAFT_111796 [Boeremia exigua]
MEIPRTISGPIDPGITSFLDLPAELRGLIYDLLFKRDASVFLHNRDAYYAELPLNHHESTTRWSDYAREFSLDQGDPMVLSRKNYQLLIEQERWEFERSADFQHRFGDGIKLLASCRQIYHEASGILYGENSFTFSRMITRHDLFRRDKWHSLERQKAYHQAHYAPMWVANIGHNYRFLHDVRIDFDAVCTYEGCPKNSDRTTIDLLPILKIKWDMPVCNIAFVHTERYVRGEYFEDTPWAPTDHHEEPPRNWVVSLNNLLKTLGEEDALMIRRHRKYFRNLESLQLDVLLPHLSFAEFAGVSPVSNFISPNYPHGSTPSGAINFSVSEFGTMAKWIPEPPIDDEFGLFRLPHNVRLHIRHHLERDVEESAINTGLRPVVHINLELNNVCKALPVARYDQYREYEASHQSVHLKISGFYLPGRIMSYRYQVRILCEVTDFIFNKGDDNIAARKFARRWLRNGGETTLVLRVKDNPHIGAHVDLRSLEQLLDHETLNPLSTAITFSNERIVSGRSVPISTATISILRLRQHLFIYLSHLLATYPLDVKPLMPPVLVDHEWNIIDKDDQPLSPPRTQDDWNTFVTDPTSAYNIIKNNKNIRRQYDGLTAHMEYYWFFLEHLLIKKVEENDHGPQSQ